MNFDGVEVDQANLVSTFRTCVHRSCPGFVLPCFLYPQMSEEYKDSAHQTSHGRRTLAFFCASLYYCRPQGPVNLLLLSHPTPAFRTLLPY